MNYSNSTYTNRFSNFNLVGTITILTSTTLRG